MEVLKFIGLVTARGGSKGVPGKNLRVVAGQSLIAWTITAARASALAEVIVSTDSQEISEEAHRYGANIPFLRPACLAEDSTGHDVVIRHAIDQIWPTGASESDYIVLLQPTSPLRSPADIDGAIQIAVEKDADSVISVCESSHHSALSIHIGDEGQISPPEWSEGNSRRQDLDRTFVLNGAIYVIKASHYQNTGTYWSNSTFAFKMPVERSLDVDTYFDLHLADLLLRYPYADSSDIR